MRNVEDFVLFAHVARHGGFAAAERATGIPKAKLSKRVLALEEALGCRLLERSTRHTRITEAGRQISRMGEAISDNVNQAYALGASFSGEVGGKIRVSWPVGLSRSFAARALTAFLTQHPAVEIDIVLSSQEPCLIDNEIDVSLRFAWPGQTGGTSIVRKLGSVPTILVAAPRLMRLRPINTVEGLQELPAIGRADSGTETWHLKTCGESKEIVQSLRLASADAELVRDAAIEGLGVALLPTLMCVAEIRRGLLVQVLPEWHGPPDDIEVLFVSTRGMRPAVRLLIDHLAGWFTRSRLQFERRFDRTDFGYIVGY